MGNLAAKLGQKKQQDAAAVPPMGILLTGMYSSGISTIKSKWCSHHLRWGSNLVDQVQLRMAGKGFQVKLAATAEDNKPGFLISSFESGGRWSRQVWRTHISSLDAIVFVVDSTHDWNKVDTTNYHRYRNDVHMARDELKRLLQEKLLQGLPLLVLCNKQDMPDAKSPQEIATFLQVASVAQNRPWTAMACAATARKNAGLQQGLDWLVTETAKRRALPHEFKQVFDGDAASDDDTFTETASEETSPSTTGTQDRQFVTKPKSRDALVALLGYDPTSTGADTTLGRFHPIRNGTACPFAKASKLWGGRTDIDAGTLTLEEQANFNIKALTEFTRRSNAGENLDGFCFELVDREATSSTPEELGNAVRRLLTALSDLDPNGEAMMRVKYIGSRGWRFRFAKADFFVTTFAPCYPSKSSRFAFGTGRAFLLLQPELSFLRHKLPVDTPHTNWEEPKTVRDKTRVAFRKAGREYYIPDTIKYPAAEHIVKPLTDKEGAVIRWWESCASPAKMVTAE